MHIWETFTTQSVVIDGFLSHYYMDNLVSKFFLVSFKLQERREFVSYKYASISRLVNFDLKVNMLRNIHPVSAVFVSVFTVHFLHRRSSIGLVNRCPPCGRSQNTTGS